MIINCICGKKKFRLDDEQMPPEGSKVKCGSCAEVWFYHPEQGNLAENETSAESIINKEIENDPVVENISEDNFGQTSEAPLSEEEELISENTYSEPETPLAEEETISENTYSEPEPTAIEEDTTPTNDIFNEEDNKNQVTKFKIFTDDDNDLPSKEEMDKNLDNFKIERENNKNFFQKLFSSDRLREAAASLKKAQSEQSKELSEEALKGRRTRLLFYLLLLLCLVFTVLMVPLREEVGMAFPFLETYLEAIKPIYDYIRVPLGLR